MKKSRYLSKQNIEDEAMFFLNSFSQNALTKPTVLDLENIIVSDLKLKLDYKQLDLDGNVLGMTIFKTGNITVINEEGKAVKIKVEKGTIILNSLLADDIKQQNRYQFTLAHEIGHWILQRKELLVDESQITLFGAIKDLTPKDIVICLNRSVIPEYNTLSTDLDWLEWQANYFASAILITKEVFTKEFYKLKGISETEKISKLSNLFGVSKQAISNRINTLIKVENPNQMNLFKL